MNVVVLEEPQLGIQTGWKLFSQAKDDNRLFSPFLNGLAFETGVWLDNPCLTQNSWQLPAYPAGYHLFTDKKACDEMMAEFHRQDEGRAVMNYLLVPVEYDEVIVTGKQNMYYYSNYICSLASIVARKIKICA
jgi:hypothetical protein